MKIGSHSVAAPSEFSPSSIRSSESDEEIVYDTSPFNFMLLLIHNWLMILMNLPMNGLMMNHMQLGYHQFFFRT
jgi:hypothetical protein